MIGGEKDGVVPNGDSPEASVARGVVSWLFIQLTGIVSAHTMSEAVLRVWRPQQPSMFTQGRRGWTLLRTILRAKKFSISPSSSKLPNPVLPPRAKPQMASEDSCRETIFNVLTCNIMRSCWLESSAITLGRLLRKTLTPSLL